MRAPHGFSAVNPCCCAALAALEALQILDLSYNQLSGSLPAHWDTPRLVELDLQSNALTGPLPAGLARLPRLSYLQLQVHAT